MKLATAIRLETGDSRRVLQAVIRIEGLVLTAGFTMISRAVGPRSELPWKKNVKRYAKH